jgi:hypothetical protein
VILDSHVPIFEEHCGEELGRDCRKAEDLPGGGAGVYPDAGICGGSGGAYSSGRALLRTALPHKLKPDAEGFREVVVDDHRKGEIPIQPAEADIGDKVYAIPEDLD